MSIRSRVLLILFGLVLLGIMAIGGYSLLFVRDYLLRTSRDDLDRQARYLATLLVGQPDQEHFPAVMSDYARYTGHGVELLDADFHPYLSAGTVADTTSPTFSGIAPLPGYPTEERRYVRITASEMEIRVTLHRIRIMIYVGILGALLLTVAVGWIVADRITFPIRELAHAARRIAGGEVVALPHPKRQDEIGDLTQDVAAMADRLQEDIRDLQRLNQAQENFIAALSHEVRNPIFSARGYLEMALEQSAAQPMNPDAQEQLRDHLQKSHRNLLRVHSLFANMLLLVRLEFDHEPVELMGIPLEPVLGELEDTFSPLADERGLALTFQASGESVEGNEEILKIALSNLLSNAIQHTGEGEVRLSVTRLENGNVRLEVSDTGEGIPPDQLDQIFEKFYRIDKARSRERGGTGLGLALVQQCMHSLNTEIQVESAVKAGSRFWFDLPAAQT
ncbi:MAG: HAMP domain-containing histidine kinase [Fidelibacterota bacterium]|nr:MAG: HAMP domain-containing histidine kinase [Candidatus Neomarinimicrobiota bacterium]